MLVNGLLLLGQTLLLWRSRHAGLRRAYPLFWVWVCVSLIRTAALLPLDSIRSPLYSDLWLITHWLLVILQLGVAWEWNEALGRHFPGRGPITNGILFGSVALALGLSILSIQGSELQWRSGQTEVRWVAQAVVVQRFFATALTLAMIFIGGVYRFFGGTNEVPQRENLSIQQLFLISFWTLQASSYWAIVATDARALELANAILSVAGPILFAAWAWALRPEGEETPPLKAPDNAVIESEQRLKSFIERSRDPR